MNTSVILPPLSWGLPAPVKAKGKEQEKEKEKEKGKDKEKAKPREKGSSRGSASSKASTSRSSRKSCQSIATLNIGRNRLTTTDESKESSRRGERRYEQPKLKSSAPPRRLRELEDAAYGSKRRHGLRRERSPGVVDHFDY